MHATSTLYLLSDKSNYLGTLRSSTKHILLNGSNLRSSRMLHMVFLNGLACSASYKQTHNNMWARMKPWYLSNYLSHKFCPFPYSMVNCRRVQQNKVIWD